MTAGTTGDRDDDVPSHLDSPRLRASDAERSATVAVLHDAVARGLLTPDEGSDRMAAAFAARYLDDLPPLTADLPAAPGPAPGWRELGTAVAAQVRHEVRDGRAAGLLSRRLLAVVVALVLALCMMIGLVVMVVHGLVEETFDLGHGHPFAPGPH